MREKLKKILGMRVFRCTNISCNWRGFIKTKTTRGAISDYFKEYNKYKDYISLCIIIFIAILLLLKYSMK